MMIVLVAFINMSVVTSAYGAWKIWTLATQPESQDWLMHLQNKAKLINIIGKKYNLDQPHETDALRAILQKVFALTMHTDLPLEETQAFVKKWEKVHAMHALSNEGLMSDTHSFYTSMAHQLHLGKSVLAISGQRGVKVQQLQEYLKKLCSREKKPTPDVSFFRFTVQCNVKGVRKTYNAAICCCDTA